MNFIFVIHNHQPVGNFDYVIEEAYKKSYKPFIDSIIDTKEFRFGIHFSGYLLQYIEKNHPELIEKLRYLVGQRRCEIISGGLYEPILILLPEKDRKEQINRMNDYIEKLFRVRPRGFWLAERVWEQELAKTLSANGIRYTFVDDTHFKVSGITEEKLRKHFITETEGNPLYVFPISKKLRYLIPFKSPEKIFEYLKEQDKDEERMELLGDDGEKFGVWPGTFKYVYEEGWLKNFLDLLKEQSSWLKMTPPM
jgi:alpha-amylase/alpha-mannosidase (GH57 family)